MKRHARSFWIGLVAEVQAGASLRDVAARHRVNPATLRWWTGRLRSEPPPVPLRLVEVEASAGPLAARAIEIETRVVALRIEEGTDVTYVAELVRALRAVC